jgi:hypothetical protein
MKYVIWPSEPTDDTLTREWIRTVFSSWRDKEIVDTNYTVPRDATHVVFIASGNTSVSTFPESLHHRTTECKHLNIPTWLYHGSDEDCKFSVDAYPKACQWVVRSYYHPRYHPRCLFLPAGLTNVFYTPQPIPHTRSYDWVFMGCVLYRPDRIEMLKHLTNWSPNFHVHVSSDFNARDGLSPNAYRKYLLQSRFCPSPNGFSSQECYRTWEALESGCVPITLRRNGYYDKLAEVMGVPTIPWPQLETWGDIVSINKEYNWEESCIKWWNTVKTRSYSLPTIQEG